MAHVKKLYAELVSLTQLFLLREYSLKEAKIVSPHVLAFFQKRIKKSAPLHSANKIPSSPSVLPSQSIKVPIRAVTIPPSPMPDPRPPGPRPEPPVPNPFPPSPMPEPQSPIIQEKTNVAKMIVNPKGLTLEPLVGTHVTHDDRELWKLFPILFPEINLYESVPSDYFAQKMKNAWLNDQIIPSVIILSFHDEEKHLLFLKNLAQAISVRLAPARVLSALKLEKDKGWENVLKSSTLRLVIASDYGFYLQPGLMPFYREVPQQGKHFLNHTPLLLLSDLSLYLKEPQLKSLLWRAICNEFAALQLQSLAL